MSLSQRVQGLSRVFLDTAPVIYYVEGHPEYAPVLDGLFARLDQGSLVAVTSFVTLAECLVGPLRDNDQRAVDLYSKLLMHGRGVEYQHDSPLPMAAATIRASYGFSLLDSIQLAVAREAGCECFITNDAQLRRFREVDVVVVKDFVGSP